MKKNKKTIVNFVLVFLLFFLSNCTNTRIFWAAKENKCLAPAANYYSLHALWYHQWKKYNYHRTYSGVGTFKFLKGDFIKQMTLNDRCEHTIQLLLALKNPNDLEAYEWENKEEQTKGRVKMLITKPMGMGNTGQVCRKYISFIQIKNKVQSRYFIACNYEWFFDPPLPLVEINEWSFYEPENFNIK